MSRDEQRRRFLARAEEADKNWKFSAGDVAERSHWDAYREAYADALRHTSTPDAPWYVVPADHKWVTRTVVASILAEHLEAMDPRSPSRRPRTAAAMDSAVAALRDEKR